MADEKPKRSPEDRRAKMYDKPKLGAAKAPAKDEKKPAEPEAKADAPDPGKDARAAMHKRHEGERRDFHGTQRDGLRKMVERHEKEISELQVAQAAEQGSPNAGADGAGAEATLSAGAEGPPAAAPV